MVHSGDGLIYLPPTGFKFHIFFYIPHFPQSFFISRSSFLCWNNETRHGVSLFQHEKELLEIKTLEI